VADGYEILSLDSLRAYESPNHGDSRLMPLRHRLDLRAFGANCWTAEVGKAIVPRHEEDSGNEELYVVVRGRARFVVDGDELDAPAGTLVHVRAGETREAFAEEPETIVLAVGATPGEPFVAGGWDESIVAFAEAADGNVDEGRAVMERLAARHPDHWGTAYNLACFEARFGDRDRAFAHLATALRRDEESARGWAERDTDLDSLRDDPRWQEIVG
jgi:mannose-6-phosphate isomerase-like protein (cupin superfamily)